MLPVLLHDLREYCSIKIKRAYLSAGILDEADHLTVSAGQHHDANGVRLGVRRGDCVDVAHTNRERFFFGDYLDRAQQVMRILAGIVREWFCKLPLSL